MERELAAGLAEVGRTYGGEGDVEVIADRREVAVLRVGEVAVKAHLPGADAAALTERLRLVSHPALAELLLAPLSPLPVVVRDRLVTAWPLGTPVDPDAPDAAPWEQSARLLARLHRVDTGQLAPLPRSAGPDRFLRTVDELRAHDGPEVREVFGAFGTLPPLRPPVRALLTHGDWHLGQLVTVPGGWRLIDVDDLGAGDPEWDLARPAALHAIGVLEPREWDVFLGAYRAERGPAVPAEGNPWPALDVTARALVVQMAARSLLTARRTGTALDDLDLALVDACARIGADMRHG
ncbi:phosphotransferase family protein [Umezawaea beigongshangensis]|uniref:phosphotransferase family protein n=1 Tax=Umezawaea beigongshangensis TaxID=2780383 RepID=UPI0027DCE1EB|nr:phosphotransferase [Umezawaea beigongshangensis]